MQTLFSELTSFAREAGEAEITGEVRAITGITLTAVGLERVLGIGERCIVHGADGPVHAEVVGIGSQGTELLPFGSWRGVAAGDRVEVAIGRDVIRPDESWKGRVISAAATPLDGKGHLARRQSAAPPARRPARRLRSQAHRPEARNPCARARRLYPALPGPAPGDLRGLGGG